MDRKVYLYAFNKVLKVVDYKFLTGEEVSIRNMRRLARWILNTNPEPVAIYAVDDRPGLYKDYKEAMKTTNFTEHIAFADMVARDGILLFKV